MSFNKRHPLLWVFIHICLLRQPPEVLPASPFLLVILLVFNIGIGITAFLIDFSLVQSVLRTVADLIVSLGFIYLLLIAVGKVVRSMQTVIAMLGVSAILNILSFPLLLLLPDGKATVGLPGIMLYVLFFWHIVIMGHIFRHALSVSLPTGMLVAFAYVLMAMAVFYSIFPVQ